MAPRTRTTTQSHTEEPSTASTAFAEPKHDPVKIFIAPRNLSAGARILDLQHPGTDTVKRFLLCPEAGLFELKKTNVPSSDPRSVLLTPVRSGEENGLKPTPGNTLTISDGFVNKDAEVLTATPYDLAFVLLQSLAPRIVTGKKALFQPLEDILDSPESNDQSLRYMMQIAPTLVRNGMLSICDTVDAGDEVMFRYNEEKVYKMIIAKAEKVAQLGLPASLEDRFVTRVLEAPMLSVKREETTISFATPQPIACDDSTSQAESQDSQSSTTSTVAASVFSSVSATTSTVTVPEDSVPAEVKRLQRVRTAYNYIVASCLPPQVSNRLSSQMSPKETAINFQPLDDYLKQLAILRAEATASRPISDFSRKRGPDDDEIAMDRAEKKKKLEEEEKRKKASESRGVRDLKKVNVSGMKKMSAFFAKKPAAVPAKT